MQTKTLEELLIEANELVKRLSYNESLELINNTQTVIIDVREESEVYNLGFIKNAVHIPRGLIEFKLFIKCNRIFHEKFILYFKSNIK